MGKNLKVVGLFSSHRVSFSFYCPLKLGKTAFSREFLKTLKIRSERSHNGLDDINA